MKPKPLSCFILFLLAGICLLTSCDDFIEPSISKKQIQPEAPANQYQSTNYTINFWWDEVDNALSYRLQVVTPGFDTIGGLILDTLVKGNKFSTSIDPGTYQWRVRAENGSSQTVYSTPRTFTVIPSSLTGQTVALSSPANNTSTNQSTTVFKWGSVYSATNYHIQIDTNNFANESNLLLDQVIPGQQISFKFPTDQSYQWRVRAENATEQSKWSAINLISYDATPPGIVTLNSPANNATVLKPIPLQWTAVTSAVNYKLYVYKSDAITVYNNTFPLLLNTNTYNFNTGNTGDTVYWQVSAVDAVGNESALSELRHFVIQ